MRRILDVVIAASVLAFVAAITLGFANAGPGSAKCHSHAGYTHCH
jgi:hypothetical protein